MTSYDRATIPEREFLEHEHREMQPGLDRIHEVAGEVGRISPADLSSALIDILHWVERVLEPHMTWEDQWLYPELDRRAGTPWATKLMSFEHGQIAELAKRIASGRESLIGPPGDSQVTDLRASLFGLEALLRAHGERENRFLVPLLEPLAAAG